MHRVEAHISHRLKKGCRSLQYSNATTLKLFDTNVKSELDVYGSETWNTAQPLIKKIQTFINHGLRRIENTKRSTVKKMRLDLEHT